MGIEEMLELTHHRGAPQMLVLARKSNLATTWADELSRHAPALDWEILGGPRRERALRLEQDPGLIPKVWLHSHEDLPAFGKTLAKYHWDLILIDECAGFRTAAAARTKLLTDFHHPLDADFKLAFSGLPMIKNVLDLYPILRWLEAFKVQRPDGTWKLGNKSEFTDRFLVVDAYGREVAVSDPVGLAQLLASCRFQVPKSTVLNIPRSWRYDRLQMPPWQRESYRRIQKDLKVRFTQDGRLVEGDVSSRLTELIRLAQVTAGFEALDADRWQWHDDNAKTRNLLDVVMPELEGEKVIVWCVFQVEAANVTRLLREAGHRTVAYYGEDKNRNAEAYASWKAGDADVFVSTLAKGSTGLNLPEASAMYYHSRNFRTDEVLQSLERNYRMTTKHANLKVLIPECEDTIDQRFSEVFGDDVRKASTWTSLDLGSVLNG